MMLSGIIPHHSLAPDRLTLARCGALPNRTESLAGPGFVWLSLGNDDVLDAIARDKGIDRGRIEVWFADEARIGQKNKITRRWARRGTRPSAPHDQRTASTYIFGAICPGEGKGAALVLPACNTEAMNLHLAEIANEVAPGKHAVLVLDQAGWHLSARLAVPDNVTLIVLPPKCPELNPAENVWQTVCSLPKRRWLVPRYATNEGCAGWTGAEPRAEGTSHAPG